MSKSSQVTTIDDAPSAPPAVKPKTITVSEHGASFSGERVTVTITQGEGVLGKQPVYLSVNGGNGNALVPRGVPCDLPVELFEVLKNAVHTVYEPDENGHVHERSVPRFGYIAEPVKAVATA